MIKFFRNIRQNRLNEVKTFKYLKYAIGEVLLVLIGILIAIQINNWNENKKANANTLSYMDQMIDDLSKDSLMLKGQITSAKHRNIKDFDFQLTRITRSHLLHAKILSQTLNNALKLMNQLKTWRSY
jgi:hypothetical protein